MFDLEERTLIFTANVRKTLNSTEKKNLYFSDINQLARSSASIGANYLEANDSLGKKDFLMRIKIARKESKETIYWLKIISMQSGNSKDWEKLIKEALELKNILSAIINKTK